MKIEQIICQILRVRNVQKKTASSQDVVLVRVRTDNGLEGIGEADASPEVIKAIIDAPFSHNIACGLREVLLGENALETERLWIEVPNAPGLGVTLNEEFIREFLVCESTK